MAVTDPPAHESASTPRLDPVPSLHTPGPVNAHPLVLEALAQPMRHHRTADFRAQVVATQKRLQQVYQTERPVVVLTSSGSGAMEAAVANLCSPGEKVAVVAMGKFGERWAEISAAYGMDVHLLAVEWGKSADPDAVRDLLDRTGARALFLQYCETSTGALNPLQEILALAREREVFTGVDAITGLLAHPLPMDEWGADAVVGGSQKAFMLPPGLAFLGLSERAQARLKETRSPRFYFDLRPALEKWASGDFPWTPAISLVQGLSAALDVLLENGLEAVWDRFADHAGRSRAVARELGLEIFPEHPANSLTVMKVPEGMDGQRLIERIEREFGIRLAGGQGKLKGKIVRLGHMGHYTDADLDHAHDALRRCVTEARRAG